MYSKIKPKKEQVWEENVNSQLKDEDRESDGKWCGNINAWGYLVHNF